MHEASGCVAIHDLLRVWAILQPRAFSALRRLHPNTTAVCGNISTLYTTPEPIGRFVISLFVIRTRCFVYYVYIVTPVFFQVSGVILCYQWWYTCFFLDSIIPIVFLENHHICLNVPALLVMCTFVLFLYRRCCLGLFTCYILSYAVIICTILFIIHYIWHLH